HNIKNAFTFYYTFKFKVRIPITIFLFFIKVIFILHVIILILISFWLELRFGIVFLTFLIFRFSFRLFRSGAFLLRTLLVCISGNGILITIGNYLFFIKGFVFF